MKGEKLEELISLFLLEELDESGLSRLQEAVHASPENRALFEASLLLDARLFEVYRHGEKIQESGTPRNLRLFRSRPLYAAIAAALLLFGSFLFLLDHRTGSSPVALQEKPGCRIIGPSRNRLEADESTFCDYRLDPEERIRIRLFPGGRASSEIHGDRFLIHLERGRLLVDSRKKKSQELILEIHRNRIRFLGTRVYASEIAEEARITVAGGEVALEQKGNKAIRIGAKREMVLKARAAPVVRDADLQKLKWIQNQSRSIGTLNRNDPDSTVSPENLDPDEEASKKDPISRGEDRGDSTPELPEIKADSSNYRPLLEKGRQNRPEKKGDSFPASSVFEDPSMTTGVESIDETQWWYRTLVFPARFARTISRYSTEKWETIRSRISDGTGEARREARDAEKSVIEFIETQRGRKEPDQKSDPSKP